MLCQCPLSSSVAVAAVSGAAKLSACSAAVVQSAQLLHRPTFDLQQVLEFFPFRNVHPALYCVGSKRDKAAGAVG